MTFWERDARKYLPPGSAPTFKWPWPFDTGAGAWFEGFWGSVNAAFQNTVNAIGSWIADSVTGLWKLVSGAFAAVSGAISNLLWYVGAAISDWVTWAVNSISSGVRVLWTSITGAFSNILAHVNSAFTQMYSGLTSFFVNVWQSLSGAIGAVGNTLVSGITSIGQGISSGLGSLWTNITGFVGAVADGINKGIGAVGSAVGSAVTTIGGWVSDLLKGMISAVGSALQSFADWLWKGLQTASSMIVGAVSQYVIEPLLGALNWIRDAIFNIIQGLWSSILGIFGGHSPITPEEAAWLSVPILLVASGAGFGVSVMGAIGSVKALGTGIEARAITDFLEGAFGLADVTSSVIRPVLSAAYEQPIRFYYNSIFRPAIPDTRTADQMLFEENIGEAEWRQIYRYHGWKEQHIDAWQKTVWREPSILILRSMAADPDADPDWIRKKMRELGYIGADAEAIMGYGKRQQVRDERTALATQIQTDFVDGVIVEVDARADLAALKFSTAEVDYRIAKAQMMIARNLRRAAKAHELAMSKAADKAAEEAETQAKREATLAAKSIKKLSEGDYDRELTLGLTTPDRYISDMMHLGYSEELAKRKLALETTPRPITAEELARRKSLVEARIARTRRRFDLIIARHDLQVGFMSDMIEYLSSLEKPPELRIITLQMELGKAADEKALIMAERDQELAELEAELKLVQAS